MKVREAMLHDIEEEEEEDEEEEEMEDAFVVDDEAVSEITSLCAVHYTIIKSYMIDIDWN